MTSVLLFLSRMDTMGIRWEAASTVETHSASLQMATAMLPFTC